MDIRNLTFDADAFDIAIDKGKHFRVSEQIVGLSAFGLTCTYSDRYDGCHDDSQGRCLGRVHYSVAFRARASSSAHRILHSKS